MARAMLAVTTDRMPCAVCGTPRPSRPARSAMALLGEIAADLHAAAQQVLAGSSVCSTTLASVTAGSGLPLS